MVKNAASDNQKWNALPSKTDMSLRRVSAVLLIAALYSILLPFAPFSWLVVSEGTDMLDRFVAPPLIVGALYAQWKISGSIMPVSVDLGEFVFVYRQTMYWQFAFVQFGLCATVLWLANEILRRAVVAAVIAALWAVGWKITPQRTKTEAWEHLKMIWIWLAVGEASRVTNGRRRRW